MKNCINCGQQLKKGSKFCDYCGASQKKSNRNRSKIANIVLFCLVVLFASSTAVFAFLYADSIQTTRAAMEKASQLDAKVESIQNDFEDALLNLATANKTIKANQKEISRLEDRIDEYRHKAIFLDASIGIITDLDSGVYHSFDCLEFQEADIYWVHNIEYCESLGYSECEAYHNNTSLNRWLSKYLD